MVKLVESEFAAVTFTIPGVMPAGEILMLVLPVTKFVPFSVTETTWPCTPVNGLMPVNVGADGGGGVPKISTVASVDPLPPATITSPFGNNAEANSLRAWIRFRFGP